MVKWYIHVNQHKIRKNIHANHDELDPPIAIKRGKTGRTKYASRVSIPNGSRLVYSPHSPILSCGARLVIECNEEPVIEG